MTTHTTHGVPHAERLAHTGSLSTQRHAKSDRRWLVFGAILFVLLLVAHIVLTLIGGAR